jgi:hypothetical protein
MSPFFFFFATPSSLKSTFYFRFFFQLCGVFDASCIFLTHSILEKGEEAKKKRNRYTYTQWVHFDKLVGKHDKAN